MVQKIVGKITSAGDALCNATRIPIIEVGISCKDVALSTKNILDAYSACSLLSSRRAAWIPYGVAAPEMPKKLTERFIQTASSVAVSSVLNSLFASGRKSFDTPRDTPHASQTFISPSHTEYVATSERQSVAALDPPSSKEERKFSGERKSKIPVEIRKIIPKSAFISILYA